VNGPSTFCRSACAHRLRPQATCLYALARPTAHHTEVLELQHAQEQRLARWRQRSAAWTRPPPVVPIQGRSGTGSDFRNLLSDTESLLKRLQRQRCSAMNVWPRTLTALARGFDGRR